MRWRYAASRCRKTGEGEPPRLFLLSLASRAPSRTASAASMHAETRPSSTVERVAAARCRLNG
jgi:hypothetical protein